MSSLFDQYEEVTSQSAGYLGSAGRSAFPELTTGYINASLEMEVPIFKKTRITFTPQHPITHLVVSNQILVLAMANKCLLRITITNPNNPHEVDLIRSLGDKGHTAKIYQLFLDPLGRHLLVSVVHSDGETFFDNCYLHQNAPKAQSLAKLKGHVISAVGWNYDNPPESNSTSYILVGTTKGMVFETELAAADDRFFLQGSPERYCKMVFQLGPDLSIGPIMGLEVRRFLPRSSDPRCYIIVTTPRRIYQFVGVCAPSGEQPVLLRVFTSTDNVLDRCKEIPSDLKYSCLQLFSPSLAEPARKFGLMLEPGVYCGDIVVPAVDSDAKDVIFNARLLEYPDMKARPNARGRALSMVLTEFHALVLFSDRLRAYCLLNEELVFEDIFPEMYGRAGGIARDPVHGTIWAFSELAVYRYKVTDEDRNVWEVYLKSCQYDLAKKHCKGDPQKLDQVLTKHAEDLFEKKEYVKSAELYAQTRASFEEVSLKFLQCAEEDNEDSLRRFLSQKLRGLRTAEKTQTTVITFWLIELFLNRLGTLRTAGRQNEGIYLNLAAEFRGLLEESKVAECVSNNRSAVYKLIAKHGEENILIDFANVMKDFERVIQYHLQNKNYVAALEVLTRQNNPELVYQFSPTLVQSIPQKTVDMWIAQEKRLDPARLIPALVQYDNIKDRSQGCEAIRYLEFCVYKLGSRDEAIHNYLLALYARLEPDKLMRYLDVEGQDQATVPYDLKYALRVCSELDLTRACVHIYTTMELYEEAVDLALKVDIDLAKLNADKPENNEELRKKLWLKIAQHVVTEQKDIKRAMEFLQECDLIKIEDILPFFDEFVRIDHFKEAICASLEEYNDHIEGLKAEMEEATRSAKEIRAEIQAFRNKYAVAQSDEKCALCEYAVMNQAFYLFPCGHMFHSECLSAEVQQHSLPAKASRIEDIHRQLAMLSGRDDSASLSSAAGLPSLTTREKLMNELDDLIASECLFCGEIAIRSVDEPFINPEDYEEVMDDWR
uniref:Vacuolar protein sorting-associated protein 18 homolog n=1 Tax=Amblyomma aureolatum TaxID=187763 RepID=A0A1E1XC32_9ACAR